FDHFLCICRETPVACVSRLKPTAGVRHPTCRVRCSRIRTRSLVDEPWRECGKRIPGLERWMDSIEQSVERVIPWDQGPRQRDEHRDTSRWVGKAIALSRTSVYLRFVAVPATLQGPQHHSFQNLAGASIPRQWLEPLLVPELLLPPFGLHSSCSRAAHLET